jgi:hypothetical protein
MLLENRDPALPASGLAVELPPGVKSKKGRYFMLIL